MATKAQQKKFATALDDGFKKWLQKVSIQVYGEAQRNAPSKSGTLISSAKLTIRDNGFEIRYKAPYAYALHEGASQGESLGKIDESKFPWKAQTKAHKRKLPGKTVMVRKHTKTYKKMYKPTKLGDEWKAVNYQNTRDIEANKWVQKAWDKIYQREIRRDKTGTMKKILPSQVVVTKE